MKRILIIRVGIEVGVEVVVGIKVDFGLREMINLKN